MIGITAVDAELDELVHDGAGLVALRRRERDDEPRRQRRLVRRAARSGASREPAVADLARSSQSRHDPRPSLAVTASPTRSRRTRWRWWPSSPSTHDVVVVASTSSTKTCATAGAVAAKPDGHRSPNVERIREKNPPSAVRATSSPRSSANWRSSSCSSSESVLRHVDVDLHEQVAAAAALQHRHAATLEPEDVTGLRARRAR